MRGQGLIMVIIFLMILFVAMMEGEEMSYCNSQYDKNLNACLTDFNLD